MRPDPDRVPANRPPRRGTDRVEDAAAWVLIAAALLLLVVAGVTALDVHGREAERAEAQRASTTQVRAVLLEDARVEIDGQGHVVPERVPARWTDRRGHEHTGAVLVESPGPAGTEIDVWVDPAGAVAARPLHPVSAPAAGIVAAVGVLCAGGTLLLAAWVVVRRLTGCVNARRWEQEWATVEPQWRRHLL
jgi:hypothetical protein